LASHFQGFCRDLHTECLNHLIGPVPDVTVQAVLMTALTASRSLDRGNAQSRGIGDDFGRFAFSFWDEVKARDARSKRRVKILDDGLNKWRNAIAHQDIDPAKLGKTKLQLHDVKKWRSVCNSLAKSFDKVMQVRLKVILGAEPW
jgi:hypothetical protein